MGEANPVQSLILSLLTPYTCPGKISQEFVSICTPCKPNRVRNLQNTKSFLITALWSYEGVKMVRYWAILCRRLYYCPILTLMSVMGHSPLWITIIFRAVTGHSGPWCWHQESHKKIAPKNHIKPSFLICNLFNVDVIARLSQVTLATDTLMYENFYVTKNLTDIKVEIGQ